MIITKKKLIIFIVSTVTLIVGVSVFCYNKGFLDNQPIANDNTAVVYITPSGAKFHKKNCKYIKSNEISISTKQAKERGYTPCLKCRPEK